MGGNIDCIESAFDESIKPQAKESSRRGATLPGFYNEKNTLNHQPADRDCRCFCGIKAALVIVGFLLVISVSMALLIFYMGEAQLFQHIHQSKISADHKDNVTGSRHNSSNDHFKLPAASIKEPLGGTSEIELPQLDLGEFGAPEDVKPELMDPEMKRQCDAQECHMYAECGPQTNGSCRCYEEFEGDGTTVCRDIDECRVNPKICEFSDGCLNMLGSFKCHCKPGYKNDAWLQFCIDIDECTTGDFKCPENSKCKNVPGGYNCLCDKGYQHAPGGFSCRKVNKVA